MSQGKPGQNQPLLSFFLSSKFARKKDRGWASFENWVECQQHGAVRFKRTQRDKMACTCTGKRMKSHALVWRTCIPMALSLLYHSCACHSVLCRSSWFAWHARESYKKPCTVCGAVPCIANVGGPPPCMLAPCTCTAKPTPRHQQVSDGTVTSMHRSSVTDHAGWLGSWQDGAPV